mmetsp:Transcript_20234/g.64589  ORF Transcript_20234/g.64589 Transcript_20234/m.64589 type:complete len:835 (-) Transcript_20234:188-2692(-)
MRILTLAALLALLGTGYATRELELLRDEPEGSLSEAEMEAATKAAELAVKQSAQYAEEIMDQSVEGVKNGAVSAAAAVQNPCSGHGTLDDKGNCVCEGDYMGTTCGLKFLGDHHAYGRFVGEKRCENGVAMDNKCECDAGWEGFHCHRRPCIHGSFGCADGKKYCARAECVCEPGFEGLSCDREKRACQVVECMNTGVFDVDTCSCECEEPWTGDLCEKCIPRQCPHGMIQDPNNCGCMCPADKKCSNGGVLDEDSCECKCAGNWAGESCDKCVPQVCHNDGIFNEQECTCECMPPYDPSDNCRTCPELECEHGGVFSKDNCSCTCEGHWTGDQCEECPTEEELALQGVNCGGKGFNRDTCSCNDMCPPIECEHGGVMDEDTCKCKCNVHNEDTDEFRRKKEGATGAEGEALASAADLEDVENHPDEAAEETHSAMFPSGDQEAALLLELAAAPEYMTYWQGDRCERCPEPEENVCEGGRSFNTTTCACNRGCADLECKNGGKKDDESCSCQCKPPYAGASCEDRANGESAEMAAVSCKAIQLLFPDSEDGLYWINPSQGPAKETAFQVYCDMTEDTGGWTQLANVGSKLKEANLDADTYQDGIGNPAEDAEYVVGCAKFNGLDGEPERDLSSVIMRVTMGDVRDYFKPIESNTLCDMITSHDKHMWSATGGFEDDEDEEEEAAGEEEAQQEGEEEEEAFIDLGSTEEAEALAASRFRARLRARQSQFGRRLLQQDEAEAEAEGDEDADDDLDKWVVPDFMTDAQLAQLLGGSAKGYPKDLDGREYLSYWGGDRGGCCHYQSEVYSDTADSGSWGREFQIHLLELPEEGNEEEA